MIWNAMEKNQLDFLTQNVYEQEFNKFRTGEVRLKKHGGGNFGAQVEPGERLQTPFSRISSLWVFSGPDEPEAQPDNLLYRCIIINLDLKSIIYNICDTK